MPGPMKHRRTATKAQALMVWLMGVAIAALLGFGVVEMMGVVDAAPEDTYTEWIADLPAAVIVGVTIVHVVAGILFIWSAGHFWEWYGRRRGEERASDPPESSESG